jgi:formylglycine-generating enzyme required for sulfatase activity
MHGNVWEWCQDEWHDDYSGGHAPTDGKPWTTEGDVEAADRVIRGGSWRNGAPYCRSAYRVRTAPSGANTLGFRLSRTLPSALLPFARD